MKNRPNSLKLAPMLSALLVTSFAFVSAKAMAQVEPKEEAPSEKIWHPKKLADGQPDLRGFWHAQLGGTYSLTNPRNGGGNTPPAWFLAKRAGKKGPVKPTRIIDPPDGEVPYQAWAREKQKHIAAHIDEPTKQEYIDPQARCFADGVSRTQWWHEFEIRQYPGYVVFVFDAATRIIHLDKRSHIPENIKLWMSDSRGHWEGNTLVVDVTNSNAKHRLSNEGDFSSDKVHITERFSFVDADTYRYEATYTDPSVYTQPWTVASTQVRAHKDEPNFEFYEYGCVEGERSAETSFLGDKAGTK
jgi:hypothetical protein